MAKRTNAATEGKPAGKRTGRPPKLSGEQLAVFRAVVLEHPNATIDDLRVVVQKRVGVQLCMLSMYRYLARVGIRRKRPRPNGKVGPGGAPSTFVPVPPPTRYGYTDSHRDKGDHEHYPGALTDAEWELVADLFDNNGPGKPPKYPRRLLLDACCYAVRTGCPWRMLPKDLPPWQDVYAHFRRWTAKNLFETMHERLRGMWRQRAGRNAAPTAAVPDSQSVKTSA